MLKASSVPKPTTALSVTSMESTAPCAAQVGPYLAGAGMHATIGKRRRWGLDTSSEGPPKRQHGVAAPGTPDVEWIPLGGSHDYAAKVHSASRPSAPGSSRSTAPAQLPAGRSGHTERNRGAVGPAALRTPWSPHPPTAPELATDARSRPLAVGSWPCLLLGGGAENLVACSGRPSERWANMGRASRRQTRGPNRMPASSPARTRCTAAHAR